MTLVAYSPLLNGAYTHPGKALDRGYDHPGTRARLEALDRVVKETGATANQEAGASVARPASGSR
jgi:hypothetical protein